MAKDVIARLKVEHSQWDSGFSKAGKTLKDFEAKNLSMAGAMDQGMKALASSAAKYVGWGAAVAGAMKVAKDAFMANEQQLDEWGRIQQSAEGAYKGFLNALNNGDISGYLSNINQIISAAREAYNALDELGTFQAFNQVNQARNKAGYSEALEAYKLNPTAENKKALSEANTRVLQDLKDEAGKQNAAYEAALEELFRGRGLTGDALKEAKRLFKEGSYADILNAQKGYKRLSLSESWSRGYIGQMDTYNGKQVTDVNGQGRWVEGSTSRAMTAAENASYQLSRAMQQVNDTEIDAVQKLGAQAFALEQAQAEQNRSFNRLAGNNGKIGGGSSGKGSTVTTPAKEEITYAEGSIGALEKKIADLGAQLKTTTSQEVRDGLLADINACNEELDRMKGKVAEIKVPEPDPTTFSADWFKSMQTDTSGMAMGTQSYFDAEKMNADWRMLQDSLDGTPLTLGVDISEEEWTSFLERIKARLERMGVNIEGLKIPINAKPVEEAGKVALTAEQHAAGAAKAFGSIGNALQQIDDPGAKVMGIIAEAIANIAATFAASLKGTFTPWDWIAAAAAGTATMISTISAIKTATAGSYAEGGWVGGSSGGFVGDAVPAFLNRGEYVMSQSDVETANSNLEAAYAGGGNARTTISGEQLVTVINNYGKRTGRGEILR